MALVAVMAARAAAPDDSSVSDPTQLSAEVQALVEVGTQLLAAKAADLDRDGRPDLVYILHRLDAHAVPGEGDPRERVLRIALRGADGRLSVAVTNEDLVLCHQCGGTWPEPFDELSARTGEFTVSHYGGSRWRWSDRWRFVHDAQARTWFLDRAELGVDTQEGGHEVRTYLRGRHFGSLRIDRFDRAAFHTKYLRKGVPKPRPIRDESRS